MEKVHSEAGMSNQEACSPVSHAACCSSLAYHAQQLWLVATVASQYLLTGSFSAYRQVLLQKVLAQNRYLHRVIRSDIMKRSPLGWLTCNVSHESIASKAEKDLAVRSKSPRAIRTLLS